MASKRTALISKYFTDLIAYHAETLGNPPLVTNACRSTSRGCFEKGVTFLDLERDPFLYLSSIRYF